MIRLRRARGQLGVSWLLALWVCGVASAQNYSVSPEQLVRRTVSNELQSSDDAHNYVFKARKAMPHGSQTRLYVQTKDAMAGLLVANDDKSLTPEQRQSEDARNQHLISDPEALKHKQKQEKEDADRVSRIVRAMPDAFIFEQDGTVPGRSGVGKPGDELVRLRFHPRPGYDPPSHTEQVLTGMEGIMLIDANRDRIAQIDGTLFKDVGFGWGILGHLDKGGHFLVEQGCVGKNDWSMTRMSLSFTGKILLFKGLNIKSEEVYSDFRPAPPKLTFAQGVELLKKQEPMLAENQKHEDQSDPK